MKPLDLRIGNIVTSDVLVENTPARVSGILAPWPGKDYYHIELSIDGLIDSEVSEVKPILLTPEWFGRFGFTLEVVGEKEYWVTCPVDIKYCFYYRKWAQNWAYYIEYVDSNDPGDDDKKYPVAFDVSSVHQLQNLYFALTGIELEIKGRV